MADNGTILDNGITDFRKTFTLKKLEFSLSLSLSLLLILSSISSCPLNGKTRVYPRAKSRRGSIGNRSAMIEWTMRNWTMLHGWSRRKRPCPLKIHNPILPFHATIFFSKYWISRNLPLYIPLHYFNFFTFALEVESQRAKCRSYLEY